jgi:hypothetical protein
MNPIIAKVLNLAPIFLRAVLTAEALANTSAAGEIEVVPTIASAEPETLDCSWVSEKFGVAITTGVLSPIRFRTSGLVNVWSLRTGNVLRTIKTPSQVLVIDGSRQFPWLIVAGGPRGKNDGDERFVWLIDLREGETIRELPLWPVRGQDQSAFGDEIQGGGISPDGKRFQLELSQGAILSYDLSRLDSHPERLPDSTNPFSSGKKALPVVPNWMSELGDSDGGLIIASSPDGVGVWRTDTWEKIMPLGLSSGIVDAWVPSPDGSVLLAMRGDPETKHRIWDFRDFASVDWDEHRLNAGCPPAFTDDAVILRYARLSAEDKLEFVSRNWRSETEKVDYIITAKDYPGAPEGRVRWFDANAIYSDDARSLVIGKRVESRQPNAKGFSQVDVLHWNEPKLGPAACTKLPLRVNRVFGVTSDGNQIFYTPAASEESSFQCLVFNRETERSTVIRTLENKILHAPWFYFHQHPVVQMEALFYRVEGRSLGPYRSGLLVRNSNHNWREAPADPGNCYSFVGFSRAKSGEALFMVAGYDGMLKIIEPQSARVISAIQRPDITTLLRRRITAPLAGKIFLPLIGGGVQVYQISEDGKLETLAQIWNPDVESWLILLPDGRYSVSATSNPPVFFRRDGKLHPVEDFDVLLNQPDVVAKVLGATTDVVERLKIRKERRLLRLGVSANALIGSPPLIKLSTEPPLRNDHAKLKVVGTVTAGSTMVKSLDVFVNDVPISRATGFEFKVSAGEIMPFRIEVPLTTGRNKVQISARDEAGRFSDRELFFVHRSKEKTRLSRKILTIGIDDYLDPMMPDLRFSGKDATDVAWSLEKVTESIRKVETLSLMGKEASRAGILAAKTFLMASQPADEVIVFLAGHGLVTDGEFRFCPWDYDKQHWRNYLTFADLESLFEGVPALNRLLLIDACHSGLFQEDAKEGEKLIDAVSDGFLDFRRTTGATVLSAAAGLEVAAEPLALKNGLFTYAILQNLNSKRSEFGHFNEITASELIKRVAKTVQDISGGEQNPGARFTNLATDFPVVSEYASLPPGQPEDVIRKFAEWSRWTEVTRLMTCFAPEVLYFGKKKSSAAIEHEERQYRNRFYIVKNEAKNLRVVKRQKEAVTLQYDLVYVHHKFIKEDEAIPLLKRGAKGWRSGNMSPKVIDGYTTLRSMEKSGTVLMEAVVKIVGKEWKISGLKTVRKNGD